MSNLAQATVVCHSRIIKKRLSAKLKACHEAKRRAKRLPILAVVKPMWTEEAILAATGVVGGRIK